MLSEELMNENGGGEVESAGTPDSEIARWVVSDFPHHDIDLSYDSSIALLSFSAMSGIAMID